MLIQIVEVRIVEDGGILTVPLAFMSGVELDLNVIASKLEGGRWVNIVNVVGEEMKRKALRDRRIVEMIEHNFNNPEGGLASWSIIIAENVELWEK